MEKWAKEAFKFRNIDFIYISDARNLCEILYEFHRSPKMSMRGLPQVTPQRNPSRASCESTVISHSSTRWLLKSLRYASRGIISQYRYSYEHRYE